MRVLQGAAALTVAAVTALSGATATPGPARTPGTGSTPTPASGSGPAARTSRTVIVRPGTNLSTVHVLTGYTYELVSGASYSGRLTVAADGVTVQNTGPGEWPVISRHSYGSDIHVTGRHDTVRWLRLTGRGYTGKNGYIIGVAVDGQDDTVTDVRAFGNLYAGVYFEAGAAGGVLSRSVIDHCNALNPLRLGSGAFGVLLWGSHNTVTGNRIDNQVTASPVYGTDGSAVEVYGGRDNVISGNTGANDKTFTELGGAGASRNRYTGNTFAGPGSFLITRGSGDEVDGPVYQTTLTGNHVNGSVISYGWRAGDGTLLTLTGNTVSVPGSIALWTDGGYLNGGHNVFTGKVITRG